ncbi:ATPase [Paenibacillus sp. N4]|uniref:BadF/BadG/BcrA/BcrD ATPase family protein n=1 Tax=Paenibacillus vietnamensis TaxID=2590547 RepID=UPI001CD08310|nr:BadF/BadG/BcrA/BcrD ATPase family protein [Paenibacillus vietnamensis]MCA0757105.1 ATPase [Paenibacillus vietnamensis]
MRNKNLVIGIDGGGSNTRVAVSNTMGKLLAYYVYPKAASLYKDQAAKDNVHMAIKLALEEAGCSFTDVCGVAAGIAGFDAAEDLNWVQDLTDLTEFSCPRWHVNDAVVAHYGALMAKPGIVVISGTGSIIFGIDETGIPIRNYDYFHYAASAARFLSYDAVYETLAGHTDHSDQKVIEAMLKHWGTSDLDELNRMGLTGFHSDDHERNRLFASFAPTLTSAALEGSALAQLVCNRAIHQIIVGIKILSRNFSMAPVSVACIGSVVNSPYFQSRLEKLSKGQSGRYFEIMDSQFPPVIGAILYAFEQLEIPITNEIITNLMSR